MAGGGDGRRDVRLSAVGPLSAGRSGRGAARGDRPGNGRTGPLAHAEPLGKPFCGKPILYCWLQAASLRLLEPNEAAVRSLPGLMFGLLGAVTTGLLAWRLWEKGDRHHFYCAAPGTDRRLVGPFRQMVPVPFSPLAQQRADRRHPLRHDDLADGLGPGALSRRGAGAVDQSDAVVLVGISRTAGRRCVAACLLGAGAGRHGLVDPHQGTGRRGRGSHGLRRLPTAGVDIFHISNFKLEIGDPTLARSRPEPRPRALNPDPRPLIPGPLSPFAPPACGPRWCSRSPSSSALCPGTWWPGAKPQLSLLLFNRSAPAGLRHGHAAARRPALVVLFAAVVGRRAALDRLSAGSRAASGDGGQGSGVSGRGPGVGQRLEVRQA